MKNLCNFRDNCKEKLADFFKNFKAKSDRKLFKATDLPALFRGLLTVDMSFKIKENQDSKVYFHEQVNMNERVKKIANTFFFQIIKLSRLQ